MPAVGSPQKRCKHQLRVGAFMEVVLVVSTEARSTKEFRVAAQSLMATQKRLTGKMQRVSDPIFYDQRRHHEASEILLDLTQTA